MQNIQSVAPGVYRVRFGEPEKLTPETLRTTPPALAKLAEKPDVRMPFDTEKLAFRATARGCTVEIPYDSASEDVYGFGLQLRSFRQSGKKKTIRTNADPRGDSGDSHAPAPFYLSTSGYGVLVDSCRYVTFYVGSSTKKSSDKSLGDGIGAQDSENQLYASRPTADAVEIEIPYASGADVYIFAGENMLDAAARYVLWSGGGAMLPMHGIAMLYRGYGQGDQKLQERIISDIRADKIPCQIYGLEPGWHTHAYSCSYEWNEQNYPDHKAFISGAHAKHMKVNLWEHAFVNRAARFHKKIAPYSGDYLVWEGLVPDFTTAEARSIFSERVAQLHAEGVDGFKLDECDSSDFTGGWSFPNHAVFPGGLDGEQYHNQFGLQYQSAVGDVYRRANERTWQMVRASHSLSAPYPFVLYSDLYDHSDFLRGLVNAGFSGLLWTPEVRNADDPDDFLRRLALTCLSPMACVNAWYLPNPPWMQYDRDKNCAGEFLPDDVRKRLTDSTRKLLELRMSLAAYLYSAFHRYNAEGIHPVRPMVLEYPDDPAMRDIEDQFMFGDSVMAAPVISGRGDSRKVVFPSGGAWFDFYTGERHDGGSALELSGVPADFIPLYVRGGAVVPVNEPVEYIERDTVLDITVRVYGEPSCEFPLYEDDGESFDYERGVFSVTPIGAETAPDTVTPMGRYRITSVKIM